MINDTRYIANFTSAEILDGFLPAAVLIASYDEYVTIREANQAYFDLTGYTKQETYELFRNRGLATLHPDDLQTSLFSLQQQLTINPDSIFNVVSRLINKDGVYRTIHFSGKSFVNDKDEMLLFMLLIDISPQIRLFEGLEKEKSFNNLIDALSDDTFFELNLNTHEIRFSKHFAHKFGLSEITKNFPTTLVENGYITEDCILCGSFDEVDSDEILVGETAFINPDGKEYWYSLYYKLEKDVLSNKPLRVVGKMNDITSQHVHIKQLHEKSEKDHLTSLYNKATTEAFISEILSSRNQEDEAFALLIIDVDNFKEVNDTLGHLFGDFVLAQLAEHLKSIFRGEDIIGRIGGDEFFVFMRNIPSHDLLKTKAHMICKAFEKTFTENSKIVEISASIGIAICPEHGTSFEILYKNADLALYTAKEKGKSRYEFYSTTTTHNSYQSTRTLIDTVGTSQKNFIENRIEYIFEMLYHSDDTLGVINSTIRLIGDSYGFSQAYIYTLDENKEKMQKVYSYITDQEYVAAEEFYTLPISAIESAYLSLAETGTFVYDMNSQYLPYEEKYLNYAKTKAMYFFAIYCKRDLLGFIGFESSQESFSLSAKEKLELATICNILSTFYERECLYKML